MGRDETAGSQEVQNAKREGMVTGLDEISGGEEIKLRVREGFKMKSHGGRKKNPRKLEGEEYRQQEEDIKKAWDSLEKREELIDLKHRSVSPESLSVGGRERKYGGGSRPERSVRLPAQAPPRLGRDNQRRLDCSPPREENVTIGPAMTDPGKPLEIPDGQSQTTPWNIQPSVAPSVPASRDEEPLDLSLTSRERARLGPNLAKSQTKKSNSNRNKPRAVRGGK